MEESTPDIVSSEEPILHLQKAKASALKDSLLAFGISFLVLLFFLCTQFLYKYKEDLFQKNLGLYTLVKIVVLTAASLCSIILPISIMVLAVVYYRQIFIAGIID